jgi:hypothetical protein
MEDNKITGIEYKHLEKQNIWKQDPVIPDKEDYWDDPRNEFIFPSKEVDDAIKDLDNPESHQAKYEAQEHSDNSDTSLR